MAREGRNIYLQVWRNFINSLIKPRTSTNLIGKDYLGNQYYEQPKRSGKPSRWYVPDGKEEDKFDEPLPAEWESWLRGRRRDPPSEEEIAANLALMKEKKTKALEIEKKFATGEKSIPGTLSNFPALEGYEQNPGNPTSTNK